MGIVFWAIGVTAQGLGAFDSAKGSVEIKAKSFPDGLKIVHFKAVPKDGNTPWGYIRT